MFCCLPLAATLSDAEQKRADRFRFEKDKQHYEICQGLLRNILGNYLGLPPEKVAFESGDRGKPFLQEVANPDRIHFNASHSGSVFICGVTQGREIGVDVEKITDLEGMEGLVKNYFSPLVETGSDQVNRVKKQ